MMVLTKCARVQKLKGVIELGGAIVQDFAVVIWPDSGVDEQVLRFCYERAVYKGRKPSTIENECYILADWLNWLASRGKSVADALPTDYHQWDSRGGSGSIGPARRHRKKEVVWEFYKQLRSDPALGDVTATFFETLSEPRVSDIGVISWSMKLKSKIGQRSRLPIVPTDDEVEQIMATLGEDTDPFVSERNFLIGQVEARIGLRAMGAESLSIRTLDTMLESAGIRHSGGSVGNLYRNKEEQVRVRRELSQLSARGRTVLAAEIVEKGGKERDVEVPVDLATKLLNHVWGRRQALIKTRRGATRRHEGRLFLSSRNGAPLKRGSIKDLVKAAFKNAGVRGSGHALRAYYLTTKAIALVQEARRKFQNNYSPEDILNELARLAGHSRRKTLCHYLDVARLREAALRDFEQ